jgi:hypothetical protein
MYRSRLAVLLYFLTLLVLFPTLTFAREPGNLSLQPAGGVTPTTLVTHHVDEIYLQNAKVWWWYQLPCIPTAAPEGDLRLEEISRIATTGGITRTAWYNEGSAVCTSYDGDLNSNVVADDEYLYWLSEIADGLVRLSVEANPGDAPEEFYSAQDTAIQIEERGNYVYLMSSAYGIIRVNKTTGVANTIINVATVGDSPRDLQVSDEYLFWRNNAGFRIANFAGQGDGVNGAGMFVAENALCPPGGPCNSTEYVFLAIGDTIRRYDVDADVVGGVLYDIPVSNGLFENITVDEEHLFWIEGRQTTCNPFCQYSYSLWRMNRTGGTAELLYLFPEQSFGLLDADLTLGGPNNDYLYWAEEGQLKRLPKDAAAIPSIDIDITDIEVNQAIQDLDNSIGLIQDKRTGVRVHVNAAGQNVEGVTAYLYLINGSGTVIDGPLAPKSGTYFLTVQDNPNRATFDHAFFYELPMEWVEGTSLRLRATVNPIQVPLEPNYSNNTENTTTFTLRESPTLKTHLISWGYTVSDTLYAPNTYQDIYQALSWIRRTYPLASTSGNYDSPNPGFYLNVRYINDENLGDHVMRTADRCLEMSEKNISKCAAAYANDYAKELRIAEGLPDSELVYSMIFDAPGLPFPRGFATDGVSAGPTGSSNWGWDNDGSYGDWYMGHEVGHNVGRPHPDDENSDDPDTEDVSEGCGHSPSDPNFPYDFTEIGLGDMWGLDVGDIGLNGDLDPRVYSNATWTDMMGYCNNQWISDYTYEEIYDFLSARAPAYDPPPARTGEAYIALFGMIEADDTPNASFNLVSLWDSPGPYTTPTGSVYEMRFLDSNNDPIAAYNFDGDAEDGGGDLLGFDVVVPFPFNTQTIQIIQNSNDTVLATHTISAAPPSVSNVALVSPTNPVTGTHTLQWNASDPDGDTLTYNVFYSPDNGAILTSFAVGLNNPSVQVDTTLLQGSPNGTFRVIANDGARQGEGSSPAYIIANKPALVTFMFPQNGLEVRYGTQVNFGVQVDDLQGHVPDNNITWRINGSAILGASGPYFTSDLLPVGTNTITARVVNSVGVVTLQNITVIVNDDVDYPGPLLAVGPDQIGWHLGVGATTAPARTLTISNVGGGTISWSATENASWLTLDVTSGGNNSTITLTADPMQVTAGEVETTIITINGDNGQTIEVPVSLLVGTGGAWFPPDAPPSGPANQLYLPLIWRD